MLDVRINAISSNIPNKAAEAALNENSPKDFRNKITEIPYKYFALYSCTVSINAFGFTGSTHCVIP